MPRNSANSGAISFSKPSQNRPKMAAKSSTSQPKATWQDVEANDWAIVKTCRRYFSGADIQDAAQQSRLRIWRKLGQFRGESSLSSWMHRVATNECLTILRKRGALKRAMEVSLEEINFDAPSQVSTFHTVAAKEAIDKLQRTPRGRRCVSRLAMISDGMSYEEIASACQISVVAAKSRVHHARVILRGMAAGVTK
jgi:RNA polymerase sigma-70 factor (ECF subfamily)